MDTVRIITLVAAFIAVGGSLQWIRHMPKLPVDQTGRFLVLIGFLVLVISIQVANAHRSHTWVTWSCFALSLAAVPFTVKRPR